MDVLKTTSNASDCYIDFHFKIAVIRKLNYFWPIGQWHIMNIHLTSCKNVVGGEITLSAGRRRSTVHRRHSKYGRMQAAYARMQPAYGRMQPPYDRMQPACSMHAGCMHAACSLHYSVVWPRHKE